MENVTIKIKFGYEPDKTTPEDIFFKVLSLITENRNNFGISEIIDIRHNKG